MGLLLGGEQSYAAFEKLLVPIIAKLHRNAQRQPFDALADVHRNDLGTLEVRGLRADAGTVASAGRVAGGGPDQPAFRLRTRQHAVAGPAAEREQGFASCPVCGYRKHRSSLRSR